LLPGSRTWEAKEGAYVVPTMAEPNNPPVPLTRDFIYAQDADATPWCSVFTSTGTAKLMTTSIFTIESPFNLQGAYFSGLDPTTVLVIDAIYVVERFSNQYNTDIATLSRPSSPYDAAVLKLYSEIARELPPGVPVSENGFGDWISGIAGVVSTVARAASFIPGPIGLVAGGIGAISDLVSGAVNENKGPTRVENYAKPTFAMGSIIQEKRPIQIQEVVRPIYDKPLPPIPRQEVYYDERPRQREMVVYNRPLPPIPKPSYRQIGKQVMKQNKKNKKMKKNKNMNRNNNSVAYSTWYPPPVPKRDYFNRR